MTAPGETNITSAPPNAALWIGVLGAPAAWGLQLDIGYAMPPGLCHLGSNWPEYALSIICILIALTGAFLSYRQYAAVGGSPEQTDGGPLARRRFLGALGTVVSLLFTMVIIAQSLPAFFFDPCST
jgi:hypothetical protein